MQLQYSAMGSMGEDFDRLPTSINKRYRYYKSPKMESNMSLFDMQLQYSASMGEIWIDCQLR